MAKVRQARKCRARRTDGDPCGAWAMTDAVVCWSHGGAAGQVRRKAAARRAERRVVKMADQYMQDAEPVENPLAALLALAGEIGGFKDFMAGRVAEMRADAWRYQGEHAEQLRAELGLYERALDRTARVLVDINKLGLDERLLQVYERQARMFGGLIERVLRAAELSPAQSEAARLVLVSELQAITGGGDSVA
jgi:hypothetical protein